MNRRKIISFLIAAGLAGLLICFVMSFSYSSPSDYVKDDYLQPRIFVAGLRLIGDGRNVIAVEGLSPNIRILDLEITHLSIDSSLDVLNNDFYGTTRIVDGGVVFTPNFALTPGRHSLEFIGKNSRRYDYEFIVSHKETFSSALSTNRFWAIPETSPKNWFSVSDGMIRVNPQSEDDLASLVFAYKLKTSFSVDFEFSPMGKNVDLVPYIINSTRDEIVLGSNGDQRNVLFHTGPQGKIFLEGDPYSWQPGSWYHVRIKKIGQELSVGVRPLAQGEHANSSLSDISFISILNFDGVDEKIDGPHYFGFSVWANSDGLLLDNAYITNL